MKHLIYTNSIWQSDFWGKMPIQAEKILSLVSTGFNGHSEVTLYAVFHLCQFG